MGMFKMRRVGKMMMPMAVEPKLARIPKPDPSLDTGPAPITIGVVPLAPPDYDPEGSPAFRQLMEGIHDMNGHRAIALVQRLEDPVELRKVQALERESPKKEGGRVGVMKAIDERLVAAGIVIAPDPSLEL